MFTYEITLNKTHKLLVQAGSPYEALDIAELELEEFTDPEVEDFWSIKWIKD